VWFGGWGCGGGGGVVCGGGGGMGGMYLSMNSQGGKEGGKLNRILSWVSDGRLLTNWKDV